MNSKLLLRFYFNADDLEYKINNLITYCAVSSGGRDAEKSSLRIIELINHKIKLSRLWELLNGVLLDFPKKQYDYLNYYAFSNGNLSAFLESQVLFIKKALKKFARCVRVKLISFTAEYNALKHYDALV